MTRTIDESDMIPDILADDLGKILQRMRTLPHWNSEKMALAEEMRKLIKKHKYKTFSGHYARYRISQVGESCLYKVPNNKRGNLSCFRGKLIRLVCYYSGSHTDRAYAAGVIAKSW